ncbi:MAG: fatty acid desaturase [Neolewinella sp.]|jgi:fatty acid desaturase
MHHKNFIKGLSDEQRQGFTRKNNHNGVIRLTVWLGIVTILILSIYQAGPSSLFLMLPLGIMLVFLFTLMHETTHKTAFANAQLNRVIAACCGVLIVLPPRWFKAFHCEHHRHTQDGLKDPERLYAKPVTLAQYLKAMSGLPVSISLFSKLVSHASGRCKDDFVVVADKKTIRIEAQLMLLFYSALLLVSIAIGSMLLLIVWVIPLLLGQPFLRAFLLAEHNGCANSDNMFDNTRTTITNPVIRFISWNMSYHTEHHVLPSVPFHQLTRFHSLTAPHLKVVQNGYWRYHLSVINSFKQKKP